MYFVRKITLSKNFCIFPKCRQEIHDWRLLIAVFVSPRGSLREGVGVLCSDNVPGVCFPEHLCPRMMPALCQLAQWGGRGEERPPDPSLSTGKAGREGSSLTALPWDPAAATLAWSPAAQMDRLRNSTALF